MNYRQSPDVFAIHRSRSPQEDAQNSPSPDRLQSVLQSVLLKQRGSAGSGPPAVEKIRRRLANRRSGSHDAPCERKTGRPEGNVAVMITRAEKRSAGPLGQRPGIVRPKTRSTGTLTRRITTRKNPRRRTSHRGGQLRRSRGQTAGFEPEDALWMAKANDGEWLDDQQ
jgi:hypothetical protein